MGKLTALTMWKSWPTPLENSNRGFRQCLRAVCCKNQLRSCNIEKNNFLKLCQINGLRELVLKIYVSSRLDIYSYFWRFFFCILRLRRPKLTMVGQPNAYFPHKRNRAFSGSSSLKRENFVVKINPGNQNTLFSFAYCRCKI